MIACQRELKETFARAEKSGFARSGERLLDAIHVLLAQSAAESPRLDHHATARDRRDFEDAAVAPGVEDHHLRAAQTKLSESREKPGEAIRLF